MFIWLWECMVLAFKAALGGILWSLIPIAIVFVGCFFMPQDGWDWGSLKREHEKEKEDDV